MNIAGNLSLNRDNHGFHGSVHDRFLVDEKIAGSTDMPPESSFDEYGPFEGHFSFEINVFGQNGVDFRFVYMLYAKIRHRLCLSVS